MDRYQIIARKDKPVAYRFKTSSSVHTVVGYMRRCLMDKVNFDGGEFSERVLELAVIQVCKEKDIAILTSHKRATLLRVMDSAQRIYTEDTIPPFVKSVVCLWDVSVPPGVKSLLRILKKIPEIDEKY